MQGTAAGPRQDEARELAACLGQQGPPGLVAAEMSQQTAPLGTERAGVQPGDRIEVAGRLERPDRGVPSRQIMGLGSLVQKPLQAADILKAKRAVDLAALGGDPGRRSGRARGSARSPS
jgi:hypothetical protein